MKRHDVIYCLLRDDGKAHHFSCDVSATDDHHLLDMLHKIMQCYKGNHWLLKDLIKAELEKWWQENH